MYLFKNITLFILITSCGVDEITDREHVKNTVHDIIKYDNQGNIHKVMNLYTRDVVLFPPGENEISGIQNVVPRYRHLFFNYNLKIETRISDIRIINDWAIVIGINKGYMTSLKDSSKKIVQDKYMMVLQRNSENNWKISHLMWNKLVPDSPD